MRNDVKPVIPPRPSRSRRPTPAAGNGGAAFDQEHGDSRRRERGDAVDPAGPKQSTVYGTLGTGGAVTDPSGTTGPVSRSNNRLSTTTGPLRDRDTERSARQGEAPDVNVLNIPTGDSSFSVPVLMAVLVGLIVVIGLVLFLAWPDPSTPDPDTPRAGDREPPAEVVE